MIGLPSVFLFCILDRSLWYTRICVESKVLVFGWLLADRFRRVFGCPPNFKAVSINPAVFLFCTAGRSFCHVRVCVEWELFLFGWHLPGRFMRVFRFPQNLKSVSIAPSRFLVLHSGPFYMAHKSLCRTESLLFRAVL
jgi:hypothetical protein